MRHPPAAEEEVTHTYTRSPESIWDQCSCVSHPEENEERRVLHETVGRRKPELTWTSPALWTSILWTWLQQSQVPCLEVSQTWMQQCTVHRVAVSSGSKDEIPAEILCDSRSDCNCLSDVNEFQKIYSDFWSDSNVFLVFLLIRPVPQLFTFSGCNMMFRPLCLCLEWTGESSECCSVNSFKPKIILFQKWFDGLLVISLQAGISSVEDCDIFYCSRRDTAAPNHCGEVLILLF